jgi:hypothetical protein
VPPVGLGSRQSRGGGMGDKRTYTDHVKVVFLQKLNIIGYRFDALTGKTDDYAGTRLISELLQLLNALDTAVKIHAGVEGVIQFTVAGLDFE